MRCTCALVLVAALVCAQEVVPVDFESVIDDAAHRISAYADGPVCQVCMHHLVFPNNGSHTPHFEPCFAKVDEVCASEEAESYSFCESMEQLARDEPNAPRGMMHVIEMANWKLKYCEWPDPTKTQDYLAIEDKREL